MNVFLHRPVRINNKYTVQYKSAEALNRSAISLIRTAVVLNRIVEALNRSAKALIKSAEALNKSAVALVPFIHDPVLTRHTIICDSEHFIEV